MADIQNASAPHGSLAAANASTKTNCCSSINLNPKKWEPKNVAKWAFITFFVSLLLLTVSSLSDHYPAASGSFLTVFTIGTGVSLLISLIACAKWRKSRNEEDEGSHSIQSSANNPVPSSSTGEARDPENAWDNE